MAPLGRQCIAPPTSRRVGLEGQHLAARKSASLGGGVGLLQERPQAAELLLNKRQLRTQRLDAPKLGQLERRASSPLGRKWSENGHWLARLTLELLRLLIGVELLLLLLLMLMVGLESVQVGSGVD